MKTEKSRPRMHDHSTTQRGREKEEEKEEEEEEVREQYPEDKQSTSQIPSEGPINKCQCDP
jgi:hypothetical protein